MKANPSLAETQCPKKMVGPLSTGCSTRLILLLLLLMMPAVVQAQFKYTTNNGTLTITGYTGPPGAVTIPATTNGMPVTTIGNSAFSNRGSVTSVTIPSSVTSIGTNAFYSCTGLTNILIGSSVTNIGDYAFYSCTKLTIVTIPNGIPYIAGHAFESCSKLGTIVIPNGVTSIGINAFFRCSVLTSVTIPSSVTSIRTNAFGLSGLTNVTIPDGVLTIENLAFNHCSSLTSATISASVTNIGNFVFASCDSLTSIAVDANNDFYSSVAGVLFNKGQTTLIQYPPHKAESDYEIPKSVTTIGDHAFIVCSRLKGVYFQTNPPSLGMDVFIGSYNATVYYLTSTTGWGATYGGRPTAIWQPLMQASDASFGVQTNQFGFNISWANGMTVVVEACTNAASPIWSPVGTNTLIGGSAYFNDPEWTKYSARLYRIRWP